MFRLKYITPNRKFVAGFVAIATLHFFVPLLNAAVSDRCCESQQMHCCQAEFPSREVCCIAQAHQPPGDSSPVQALAPETVKTWKGIVPCLPVSNSIIASPSFEIPHNYPTIEFTPTDNKLYKRFSVFLI